MGGYGYDINDRGQVAFFNYSLPGAVRWDPRDGHRTVARGESQATGINNRGDVTVVHGSGPFLSSLWTERDGLIDLGTIGRQTWADDVNDHQVVVGWTERVTDARERYAFRWTRDGGLQTLPNLPGGPREGGAAFDVTNRGLVVGYSYGANGQEAVRWVDGQAQGLGDLPGGLYESAAFAANERGQIVGVGHLEGDGLDSDRDGQPDPIARAFLWSEEKGMINLGTLGPDDHSVAYDITDDGMVVGYSVKRPGGMALAFKPFVWTEETGMVDVHTLLDEDSQQWQLGAFQTGRINESGQLLLYGALDNQYALVVLTPHNPEPEAVSLIAGAFAVLALRRVRVHAPNAS